MVKVLISFLIIINLILSARWVFDGNIFFHTDIARDFLLMEDIIDNKHPTLIGPRSGAIPGVFHGPLWLYINLPAYFIGGGNPVVVGWFWVFLYIVSLFVIYWVGKKMFDEGVGLLSALLLSSVTVLSVRSLFNPYGALLLSPLFFYTLIYYLQTLKVKVLVLSIFILGLIIQFQMAFGIPILVLTFIYLTYYLYQNKNLKHLLSFIILFAPLSSFLLFDLRNKFLQTKSAINYLIGIENHGKENLSFTQLINLRFQDMVYGNLGEITYHVSLVSLILVIFFIGGLYLGFKKKRWSFGSPHFIFIYLFTGFWFISFLFKGPIWSYYYLPFIPLIILFFCSLSKVLNKKIFYPLLTLLVGINLIANIQNIASYQSNSLSQDVSTWKFNLEVAGQVYKDAPSEFGYYIFTPDLYGYSPRYAMNYYQKTQKDSKSYPYNKKSSTYLIIAPPPEYGKDPNSIWYKKNINSASWKINDIKIDKQPARTILFNNGFMVEKYELTGEEMKIPSNPHLIQSIFFR